MTVSSTNRRTRLACNGSATEFSFTFKIYDADDVYVVHSDADGVETVLTRVASSPSTDEYTVAGVGVDAGGAITTGSTYASGEFITMIRNLSFLQGRAMSNLAAPRGDTVETALDELTMMVQQLLEQVERQLLLKVSTTHTQLVLPEPVADAALTWNSAGDALTSASLLGLGTVPESGFSGSLKGSEELMYTFDLSTVAGFFGSIELVHTFEAGYHYQVRYDNVGTSVGSWKLQFLLKNDGGTTVTTAGYRYSAMAAAQTGEASIEEDFSPAYQYSGFAGHASGDKVSGELTIFSPMDTAVRTTMISHATVAGAAVSEVGTVGTTLVTVDGHTSAFFQVSAGTLDTGILRVYRYKDTLS